MSSCAAPLVVFTSGFGRTPWSQNITGRDHNAKGFTTLLAGGGAGGGGIEGAMDEVGYKAVESPHVHRGLAVDRVAATVAGLQEDKMDLHTERAGVPIRRDFELRRGTGLRLTGVPNNGNIEA